VTLRNAFGDLALEETQAQLLAIAENRGQWAEDTTVPLAANASWTGPALDLIGLGVGDVPTGFFGQDQRADEVRCMTVADAAGTLCLEVRSQVADPWRRVRQVAAATEETGGLYVAELQFLAASRFARIVYENGPDAQSHFLSQTLLLAA